MEYAEFETKLKELKLSKKEFSKLVNMQYESVTNWKRNKAPHWVKSWLYYYEKSQILDTIMQASKKLNNKRT